MQTHIVYDLERATQFDKRGIVGVVIRSGDTHHLHYARYRWVWMPRPFRVAQNPIGEIDVVEGDVSGLGQFLEELRDETVGLAELDAFSNARV